MRFNLNFVEFPAREPKKFQAESSHLQFSREPLKFQQLFLTVKKISKNRTLFSILIFFLNFSKSTNLDSIRSRQHTLINDQNRIALKVVRVTHLKVK